MIRKLILQNTKSSVKNYIPYFSVLSVSICIFYAFNSYLTSEKVKAVSDYFSSNNSAVIYATLIFMFGMVAVSFVATKNLYSYRSKEFSVYITLGLPTKKIFLVTVFETIIITVLALIIGIFLGSILFELFMAVVFSTFKQNYQFSFESNKTTLLFTVSFFISTEFLSSVCNACIMSRKSPLDLYNISSKKKLITLKGRTTLTFILSLSIACGAFSILFLFMTTRALFDTNEQNFTKNFFLTVLFFLAFVTGLAISLFHISIKHSTPKNYSGLGPFLKSKFLTEAKNIIPLVVVSSIMLTLSFSLFTVGSIYTGIQEQKLINNYPFDVMFVAYQKQIYSEKEDGKHYNINDAIHEVDLRYGINNLYIYDIYSSPVDKNTKEIFESSDYDEITRASYSVDLFMKLSDYNTIRRLQGEKELILGSTECAIHSQNFVSFVESKRIEYIQINGSCYKLKDVFSGPFAQDCSEVGVNGEYGLVFVVPDIVCSNLEKYKNITIINTKNKIDTEADVYFNNLKSSYSLYLSSIINNFNDRITYKETNDGYIKMKSGNNLAEVFVSTERVESGRTAYVDYSFFFFYLGFIFAIVSIVLLVLYKLGKVIDDQYEYKVLDKLGVSKEKQKNTLLKEIGIIFGVPVVFSVLSSLAIFFSVFRVFNSVILDRTILWLFILSQGFISVIYLGFFAITYFSLTSLVIMKDEYN